LRVVSQLIIRLEKQALKFWRTRAFKGYIPIDLLVVKGCNWVGGRREIAVLILLYK